MTFTPAGGAVVQPSRRNAIHAFDGNLRPPASCPEASTSTSPLFQCSPIRPPTMPATRSAHQPTRSASTAWDST
ncbi:hypothetical protein ACNAW0_29480, partial [Micromonospora sp. SL1-18]|uniref:hypothetical protein n=1 Tax=Micromonospora sp. SL1-18 TaxID=3399128 RepID=UPI003A4E04AC